MKLMFRLAKEALRYKAFYVISITATFLLTVVNLIAPKILSKMTAIVESGVDDAGLKTIGKLTIILCALYFSRIVFRFTSNYLSHKAAWNLVGDMRSKVFRKLEFLDLGFFHDKQTGDLMSRVVNDTRDLEMLYAHIIPDMFTNIVMFVGVLVILLGINTKLALITCAPLPLIFVSGFIFVKKIRPCFKKAQSKMGELNATLQDDLSGIHEIQSFGQEEFETESVSKLIFEHVDVQLHALKLSGIFHPTVEFVSSIGTILVVSCGGVLAYKSGLQVSDIVAFLLYLGMLYGPVSGLAQLLENLQQAQAGAERAMMILDTESKIVNLEDAKPLTNVKGSIEFENVDFHYIEGEPVLHDINFKCEPGQMIALVGPTGIGKTTLTQLISRFYDPVNGRVLIDGQDIKHVTLDSLRGNISPVLQDTFLFNGTIEANIAYAKKGATHEEIVEAAKAARIHDDIMNMPQQYETRVGERGLRLSGGEKQRVAIARAILRKSPIIILDEATASVDVETEKHIQEAVNNISGSSTIVAIAHRLSTIRNADRILVISEGTIKESGTHEELLKLDGIYAHMDKVQRGTA